MANSQSATSPRSSSSTCARPVARPARTRDPPLRESRGTEEPRGEEPEPGSYLCQRLDMKSGTCRSRAGWFDPHLFNTVWVPGGQDLVLPSFRAFHSVLAGDWSVCRPQLLFGCGWNLINSSVTDDSNMSEINKSWPMQRAFCRWVWQPGHPLFG